MTESNLTLANLVKYNAADRRLTVPKTLEKKVDDYLNTLDRNTKSQLSRTQLIKSQQKVQQWKKQNRKMPRTPTTQTVPKKFLEQDLDPSLFNDKQHRQVLQHQNIRTGQNRKSKTLVLDGLRFEKDLLNGCEVVDEKETKIKRVTKMSDYLAQRATKLSEREKLLEWIAPISKRETIDTQELIKMYQQKKRSHMTVEELVAIYHMKENKDLSTYELLELYRQEVQPAASQTEGDEDDPPDSSSEANNANRNAP